MAAPDDSRYPHVVRALAETPWPILPGTLDAIREAIAIRASGGRLTDEEIQARIGTDAARRGAYMAGPVAVLPLYGVIVPKADAFTRISGGTDARSFAADFRDALEDGQTRAIVIDIDSPGGQATGIPELAAEIRQARGKKPIVAVANPRSASAAYWIGAQADELVVTPSGDVGSIGVFAVHEDISAMQEKLGVKTTLVSAGKFKTEGNPFEPLTDEARVEIQRRVDEIYGAFISDVAKGRRVSVETVRKDFGEGRMVTAKTALAAGMVDRVDTLDATIARLTRGRARSQPPEPDEPAITIDNGDDARTPGLSFAAHAAEASYAADEFATRARAFAEKPDRPLTGAKRDQLTACQATFAGAAEALAAVLEEERDGEQATTDDDSLDLELAFAEQRTRRSL